MAAILDTAKSVYAPGPTVEPTEPNKADIIRLFGLIEAILGSAVNGLVVGGAVVYQTRAALFANLARPDGSLGIVYGDSNPAYNGYYAKVGASGSGSWTLTNLALPSTFAADLAGVIAAQATTQAEVTAARGGQPNLAAQIARAFDAIGEVTDEVVAARGEYGDLAAYLQALADAIAAGGGEAGEAIAGIELILRDRINPQLVAALPVIEDFSNLLGGGSAIYVPRALRASDIFDATLEGGDVKLTEWVKLPVSGNPSVLISAYYDREQNAAMLAVAPEVMPADPSRYFHIATFYGDNRGRSSGNRVESTRSSSMSVVGSYRPFVFDLERGELRVPQLAGYTWSSGAWSLDPVSGGSIYREVSVAKLPGSVAIQFVWLDVLDLIKNGGGSPTALHVTEGYGQGTNPLPSGQGGTVLLGTIFNEMFHPAPSVHAPCANIRPNECGVGKADNDLAAFRYDGTRAVDLEDDVSISFGFTRGYANPIADGNGTYRSFYGDYLNERVRGGVIYARAYEETDIAGEFCSNLALFGIDASGNPRSTFGVNVSEVRRFSPHVREVEGWFRLTQVTGDDTYVGYWFGGDSPVPDRNRFFGLQACFGTGTDIACVAKDDYPRKMHTLGNRLQALENPLAEAEALEPIIPEKLYLLQGRSLTIQPDQMFGAKNMRGLYRLDLSSVPSANVLEQPVNLCSDGADSVVFSGADTPSIIRMDFVDTRGVSSTRVGRDISIAKVSATVVSGLAKRCLLIGDSIFDWNGTMNRSLNRLNSLGANIAAIGTLIQQEQSPIGPAYTVLGEARAGMEFADYIHMNDDAMLPVAPGQEAAYLALGYNGRERNPFVRPATGSDPSDIVFNDYVFDMRFYLQRFGLADPDIVFIGLGTNDISQQTLPVARAQIRAGVRVMVTQTRTALPTTKIALVWHSLGRGADGDQRWVQAHLVCLRETYAYLRELNDPNVYLMPAYCSVSRDTGFPVTESTNSATGLVTRTQSDFIHYGSTGVDQFAEMGAATLAGLLAGL